MLLDWHVYGGAKELYDVVNSIAILFDNMGGLLKLFLLFSLFFAFLQGIASTRIMSFPSFKPL